MSTYLIHHGIKGQKWGKRNGPPYPIAPGDHSSAEKKAGYQKSIDKKSIDKEKLKKYAKYGAIACGVALTAVGTYKLAQSGTLDGLVNSGKQACSSLNMKQTISSDFVRGNPNAGKTRDQVIHENSKMIHKINAKFRGKPEGDANCAHCSVAYILNSLFGKNVTANSLTLTKFGVVDEVSGMVMPGRTATSILGIFDNVIEHDYRGNNIYLGNALKQVANGSTGIIQIRGHFFNYEKDTAGKTTLIDCQSDEIYDNLNVALVKTVRIFDMTNATIRPDAEETIKIMVNGYN